MLSALRRVAGQVPQVHRTVATATAWRAVAAPVASRAYAKRGPPHPSESFLRGSSAMYVEEMYLAWKNDPNSVHKSWDVYFRQVENGAPPGQAFVEPPTLRSAGVASVAPATQPAGQVDVAALNKIVQDTLNIQQLIRAYQVRGHNIAKLDPLGIRDADLDPSIPSELQYQRYGFTEADLDRKFVLGSKEVAGILASQEPLTLREILDRLNATYCGSIGVEYMHIKSREECNWLRERLENRNRFYSADDKRRILDRLIWSDSFERFVASKYPSEKRFGLEGAEALIPAMKAMVDRAADLGADHIVMGMPHRGRLNVLSNIVRKPNEAIFCEFSGSIDPDDSFSGDVKYHLGMNTNRPTHSGKMVTLSLEANPSHLEAVNPVVMGKARALQYFLKDETRQKVVALLLHGDASFAGQGIVYESLGLTNLPNYTTGGVMHIVVNNQIGFTTDPRFARSTPYCTDIALALEAPIFHVNADDVESVVYVAELAAEYRERYHKDVVIDLVCYRRHGHNEVDQPAFTQPLMYKRISQHPRVLEIYSNQLVSEGTITAEELKEMKDRVWGMLEESYGASKTYKVESDGWTSANWMTQTIKNVRDVYRSIYPEHKTGVPMPVLKKVGDAISSYPESFKIHDGLARILAAKRKTIETGVGIDMPTAEALAFGTLLVEGTHVRLSGQDVERGTFSHRHAVLVDQETEARYIPLNNISDSQEKITVTNSHLSEYGVMGFELGYSFVNPNSLVCWEAQFGDFANTAQCIIDQFIVSGERKWQQRTGLALLLPHGYDGAGPEHSSGRMERFLQMCDDHPDKVPDMSEDKRRQIQDINIQVIYPSTPANYFHALRRQIHRDFRKPVVIFNSKSLLRHPEARSSLEELADDAKFRRVIPDTTIANPSSVRRVIFCSGQVYYMLAKARQENGFEDIAIARVEQIAPFPYDLVAKEADRFPNAEIVWAQEEPMNAGAWAYVQPRIRSALGTLSGSHKGVEAKYAGRQPSASTATGNKKQHQAEEKDIVSQAFFSESRPIARVSNGVPVFA